MLTTRQIRVLIIKNEVVSAFAALEGCVQGPVKDQLHLLWARFNYWEKQHLLGLSPAITDRNHILYSLLQILSELENDKALLEMEAALASDYDQLTKLTKQGEIDKLLNWLIERHPAKFQERTGWEVENRNYPISATLSEFVLGEYIQEKELGITTAQLLKYVQERYASMPRFFTEWANYSNRRNEVVPSLKWKIELGEKKYYKKLLMLGILSGIGGAALMAFFIEMSENDIGDNLDDNDD